MADPNPVQRLASQMQNTQIGGQRPHSSRGGRGGGAGSSSGQQRPQHADGQQQQRSNQNNNNNAANGSGNANGGDNSQQPRRSARGGRGGRGGGGGGRDQTRNSYLALASAPTAAAPQIPEELQAAMAASQAEQRAHAEARALSQQSAAAEESADPQWKERLALPPRDTRLQTEDVTSTKGLEWEDLHLKRDLLKGIFEMGYERPSPIQEESIPIALMGRHVLARAKNGTGKTASFAIPVIDKIDPTFMKTQALVLVPTRELALQTSSVLKKLGKHFDLNIIVSTGGTDLKDDIIRLMKPVHIIVATPGRILDLCNKRVCDLSACNMVSDDSGHRPSPLQHPTALRPRPVPSVCSHVTALSLHSA